MVLAGQVFREKGGGRKENEAILLIRSFALLPAPFSFLRFEVKPR
jgi:hypothetical protein